MDPGLVGFSAGFSWGPFAVLVPHAAVGDGDRSVPHGKVVAVDLRSFVEEDVSVVDLSTVLRRQVPKLADPRLRGFVDGFAAGDYAYFVPCVCRFSHRSALAISRSSLILLLIF